MKDQIAVIVTSNELKDITTDIVEKVLDSRISEEILKEIPILKTLVGIRSVYTTYTDRIFIKKAMRVLLELGKVNWKQRVELTKDLDDEDSSGTEKILMAIDNLETQEKCKVFGRLCRLKALNLIDKNEFSRLTKLIQDAYLDDLDLIIHFESETKEKKCKISEENYYPLISLGLICQVQYEPEPIEQIEQPYDMPSPPKFKGGEVRFEFVLTMLGAVVLNYYYELFPEHLS